MIRFECELYLVVSYFDEVFGPQIAGVHPPLRRRSQKDITDILTNLLDIVSVNPRERKHFIFADESFVSQNVLISIFNPEGRGNVSDFLISILVRPNYSHVIAALASDWTSLFSLEDDLLPILLDYIESKDFNRIREKVEEIYLNTRSTLQYNLEAISPESYVILSE